MAGVFSRALRQFTLSKGKSAGRNSSGRITIFHRGGGAKRLQRVVDLKRGTPSMGVVERIEYDPNRSSRIALVRWEVRGPKPPDAARELTPPKSRALQAATPTTTVTLGPFAFSSLPGAADGFAGKGKITCGKDAMLSAFSTSSSKAKGENASNSFVGSSGFPRIAVAGAKPPFFVLREREKLAGENTFSLEQIRKWKTDSSLWDHRMKRKSAVSWHSFGKQERLGLVGACSDRHKEFKPKSGASIANRAPVSYILASNKLEVGKVVMNCAFN